MVCNLRDAASLPSSTLTHMADYDSRSNPATPKLAGSFLEYFEKDVYLASSPYSSAIQEHAPSEDTIMTDIETSMVEKASASFTLPEELLHHFPMACPFMHPDVQDDGSALDLDHDPRGEGHDPKQQEDFKLSDQALAEITCILQASSYDKEHERWTEALLATPSVQPTTCPLFCSRTGHVEALTASECLRGTSYTICCQRSNLPHSCEPLATRATDACLWHGPFIGCLEGEQSDEERIPFDRQSSLHGTSSWRIWEPVCSDLECLGSP